jgi:hypothetical protein
LRFRVMVELWMRKRDMGDGDERKLVKLS